jgi:hypothetical protein
MTGTVFDPGTANTGESKIVSLILPDAAKSVEAGTYSNPTFENFTALTSVAGAGITAIGDSAFAYCTTLETATFPAAETIDNSAFSRCDVLTEATFPAATAIGNSAFFYCTALGSLSLPASPPSLGSDVFYGTKNGASTTLTIRVPSGKVTDYTTTWGVSAETAAGGNTGVYGTDHKAITITDS